MDGNMRKIVSSLTGLLLTANSVLAADNSSGGSGLTSHLGPVSGLAGDTLSFIFWAAVLSFVIGLLASWIVGNISYASGKAQEALKARNNKTAIIIEAFIVTFSLIVFFGYFLPYLKTTLGIN
jgi:hypothetical protein